MNTDQERAYIQACLLANLFSGAMPAAPQGLDWDKFIQLVNEEQLGGVLAKISRTHPEWLPGRVGQRLLYRRYRQLLFHADWGAVQARVVLRALQEGGIPVIVLKGWALVALVYDGDYSQRPAVDIDLLVKPEDAGRAIEALEGLGYAATDMEPWPGYFRRFLNGVHYTSARGTGEEVPAGKHTPVFNVDLHWGFPDAPYYDRRIAVEGLFEGAQPIQVAGVDVHSLSIEDMLIYGSVHMAHHGYTETLSRYYDLAALIRRAGAGRDWKRMLANAGAWRVIRPLQRMLSVIEGTWPGVLPVGVGREAEQLHAGWKERLTDWGLRKAGNTMAASILLAVLNTPGLGRRLRFFLETAFPSSGYLQHYFGPAPLKLWPWLYFRRIKRFLGG
jgi:hypothetical protein